MQLRKKVLSSLQLVNSRQYRDSARSRSHSAPHEGYCPLLHNIVGFEYVHRLSEACHASIFRVEEQSESPLLSDAVEGSTGPYSSRGLHSSALKMEASCSVETPVNIIRLHGIKRR